MTLRLIAVAVLFGVLAGCASDTQPRNVENACAIYGDRPHWKRALERSEAKWGAPAHVQMAIIWRESSFRPDAKPPRGSFLWIFPGKRPSTAEGFPQAIDGTWDWYRRDTRNSYASRSDFDDAADFVGWYMAKTRAANGVAMSDAFRHYLNYHEGHAGYRRGSWQSKDWLRKAASDVERKAAEYRAQMARCT